MAHVVPQPAFVVKLKDRRTTGKVFLNVCAHDSVPDVEDWEGVERAAKGNLKDVERMRIPMRMSVLREDVDKAGNKCQVADCVVHTEVVRQAAKNKAFQTLLVHAAIDLLQGKQSALDLDVGYKLPKLRYKGETVQPMSIKPNLIRELSSSNHQSEASNPNMDNKCSRDASEKGARLGISITYEGTPVDAMKVSVRLSHIEPLEGLAVGAIRDQLRIHHGAGQAIHVQLPFYADTKHSHAHLHTDRSLTVHLPVLLFKEYCAQPRG
eukprot:scaffold800_cov327-Pavlova_lutheri.AAC.2